MVEVDHHRVPLNRLDPDRYRFPFRTPGAELMSHLQDGSGRKLTA